MGQQGGRIAFQGALGAYSHQACTEAFPGWEGLPCVTFEGAIAAVREGRADLAMLPVENSTYGRVADIHHLLPESGLHIIGEHFLRVHINLLALPGAAARRRPERDEPHGAARPVPRRSCASTASPPGSAPTPPARPRSSRQAGDRSLAALASELAGEIYGLEVLARHIEDQSNNTTRFLVMSPEPRPAPVEGGADHLRLPGAQHPGGALQGDGRLRDQRRQHDQARELHDRRPVHRDAVLRRHRGPPGRAAGAPGARRARPISPPSCRSSASIRGIRSATPGRRWRWRPRRIRLEAEFAPDQGTGRRWRDRMPPGGPGALGMAIDEAQIRLVRESLPLVRERLAPASLDFYENLFAVAPELRGLFRTDLASQGMRFMSTLATIADLLDAPGRARGRGGRSGAGARGPRGAGGAFRADGDRADGRRWPRRSGRPSRPSCRRRGTRPMTISPSG